MERVPDGEEPGPAAQVVGGSGPPHSGDSGSDRLGHLGALFLMPVLRGLTGLDAPSEYSFF